MRGCDLKCGLYKIVHFPSINLIPATAECLFRLILGREGTKTQLIVYWHCSWRLMKNLHKISRKTSKLSVVLLPSRS